jgi:RNA polymerase sigma-70 factor, ECF subfamily
MLTETELQNLLFQSQNGNREAFGFIYDHFRERIYKFIFFRVGHKELAEDILSDTFVKAWVRIQDISSPKALSSWIYSVAKNNVIDYYRVKKVTIDIAEVSEFLVDAANPIDSANLSVEHAHLLDILSSISEEQRLIIQYKFFEDLTNEEIASIMGKTEGAVRVLQHRAILKLKQLIKRKIKKP